MEVCIICSESTLHMCIPCKLLFCSKHKEIHEKRKIQGHIINKSERCLSSNVPAIPQTASTILKTNPFISAYSSWQKMTDLLEWHNQSRRSSLSLFLTEIKAKYLEHKLSRDHQIFLQGHTSYIKSTLITSDIYINDYRSRELNKLPFQ